MVHMLIRHVNLLMAFKNLISKTDLENGKQGSNSLGNGMVTLPDFNRSLFLGLSLRM